MRRSTSDTWATIFTEVSCDADSPRSCPSTRDDSIVTVEMEPSGRYPCVDADVSDGLVGAIGTLQLGHRPMVWFLERQTTISSRQTSCHG